MASVISLPTAARMIEPTDTGNEGDRGEFRYGRRGFRRGRIAGLCRQPARGTGSQRHRLAAHAGEPPALAPVGGYSIEFGPGMSSDDDFLLKLWLVGCRIYRAVDASRIYHFGCSTTRRVRKNKGGHEFLLKWGVSQGSSTRLHRRKRTRQRGGTAQCAAFRVREPIQAHALRAAPAPDWGSPGVGARPARTDCRLSQRKGMSAAGRRSRSGVAPPANARAASTVRLAEGALDARFQQRTPQACAGSRLRECQRRPGCLPAPQIEAVEGGLRHSPFVQELAPAVVLDDLAGALLLEVVDRLSPTPRKTRQPACQSFIEKSLSLLMPGSVRCCSHLP